jgi:hypothetical protein
MSVAIGRIERAPRAVMVATIAASLVGLSLVLALMVTAPMISVPTSVRTLYGSTTRCRLHRPIWLEAKAVMPKDVVLYDVDANYAKAVEHTPPFRLIGYDRTRSTILSSTELFLALTRTNNDAEFLAFTAVNLLVDAAERHPDERASIDGRELHFSYALFPEAYKGRRWRDPSKKTVYRCSVNLDTAVRPPCAEVEVDDPDGDGGHMGTSNIRERDPHHAK